MKSNLELDMAQISNMKSFSNQSKVKKNNVADRDNQFTKHQKPELGLECHVID